jgi:hypothetical protein
MIPSRSQFPRDFGLAAEPAGTIRIPLVVPDWPTVLGAELEVNWND